MRVEWPGVKQSRVLLRAVPWKVARGRSGFLPHLVYVLLFAPTLVYGVDQNALWAWLAPGPVFVFMVTTAIYALIGGIRRGRRVLVGSLAAAAGLLTAAIPLACVGAIRYGLSRAHTELESTVVALLALVPASFIAAYIFGAYLAILTWLGLENTQAFTALDHPGFKHFVRLRVRRAGDAVDVWCIGLIDPLGEPDAPILVDHFTWSADGTRPDGS